MKQLAKYVAAFAAVTVVIGYMVWINYDHIAAFILHPQTASATGITDDSFGLVTPDGSRFSLDALDDALSAYPADGRETRPLVLFVHGFGPNPDGEFGLYTMSELAKGSGADVLMFTWPSWISVTQFPVLNAVAAAEKLTTLLQEVAELKQPGGALENRPVAIVGHSMAGEVMRNLALSDPDLPQGLLSRVLLAVPETELKDHHLWMEKLGFTDEAFVFVNTDDPALQVTTLMYNAARLGRSLTNLDGTPEPLAPNVDYIVLDPESWRHYFFISGQRNEAIDEVFSDILKNGKPALANRYLRREPKGNVYDVVGPGAETVDG